MRLRRLNELMDKWSNFSDEYFIGDDGMVYRKVDADFIVYEGSLYRRLKSGYYRSKKHPYQQIRQPFGTDENHTIKPHIACALAFVPKPFNATDVDHINNDKTDNRAVNLQWLTHRDNLLKKLKDNGKEQDNG